jgi:hypothetical protein
MKIDNKFVLIEIPDDWKWRYLWFAIRHRKPEYGYDDRPKDECYTGRFILSISYYDGFNVLVKLHRWHFEYYHI